MGHQHAINLVALRNARTLWTFGLSECKKVKEETIAGFIARHADWHNVCYSPLARSSLSEHLGQLCIINNLLV